MITFKTIGREHIVGIKGEKRYFPTLKEALKYIAERY